jgi:hypothetical protein
MLGKARQEVFRVFNSTHVLSKMLRDARVLVAPTNGSREVKVVIFCRLLNYSRERKLLISLRAAAKISALNPKQLNRQIIYFY